MKLTTEQIAQIEETFSFKRSCLSRCEARIIDFIASEIEEKE
jgi:hypothetical protein